VDLERKRVVLYTRKKKGGHLTPRKVKRLPGSIRCWPNTIGTGTRPNPALFWVRHWSSKAGGFVESPYQHRKRLMATLCQQAGVRHFGFHANASPWSFCIGSCQCPHRHDPANPGHENQTTTENYLHEIGDAEQEAMAIYERIWQGFQEKSHT
jgi:hypothetical protein